MSHSSQHLQRVVVTGMAGLCPLGMDWEEVKANSWPKRRA